MAPAAVAEAEAPVPVAQAAQEVAPVLMGAAQVLVAARLAVRGFLAPQVEEPAQAPAPRRAVPQVPLG